MKNNFIDITCLSDAAAGIARSMRLDTPDGYRKNMHTANVVGAAVRSAQSIGDAITQLLKMDTQHLSVPVKAHMTTSYFNEMKAASPKIQTKQEQDVSATLSHNGMMIVIDNALPEGVACWFLNAENKIVGEIKL